MKRRILLGATGTAFVMLSGCLAVDGGSDDVSGGTTDIGDVEFEVLYAIEIDSLPDGADIDDEICAFGGLPDDVQDEIERAVDEGTLRLQDSPALLKTECYDTYVEYDGQYYRTSVDIERG